MKIMNLRRTLTIAAFPFCFAAVAAIATHSANAQNASQLIAQRPDNQQSQAGNQNSSQRPQHPRPDFADAASRLGITEAALKNALGVPETRPANGERPARPDFAEASAKLGITETQLKDALRVPEERGDNQRSEQRPDHQQGQMGRQMGNQDSSQRPQHPRPDFADAASKLGITEAALKTALGVPETRPANGERPARPDFADAAAKLGITETQLTEALGVPGRRGEGQGYERQSQSGDRPSMPLQ